MDFTPQMGLLLLGCLVLAVVLPWGASIAQEWWQSWQQGRQSRARSQAVPATGINWAERYASLPSTQPTTSMSTDDPSPSVVMPSIDVLAQPLEQRKCTLIAGAPGDGKTQTSIAFLVADVARGAQVVWLNPHLALFHPDDQTTDLRPLARHFESIFEYDQIATALANVYTIVQQRMPLYREGLPVGHHIVLVIDEAPICYEVLKEERFVKPLQAIVREGRKTNVWVVLATQDAQVNTLGFKSGVRESFKTRIVGNVEQATWSALIGVGIPRMSVVQGRGEWIYSDRSEPQRVQIARPTAMRIEQIAARAPHTWPSLVEKPTAVHEAPASEDVLSDDARKLLTILESWDDDKQPSHTAMRNALVGYDNHAAKKRVDAALDQLQARGLIDNGFAPTTTTTNTA